jgi:type IV pilus assembly protein PilA
MLTYLTRLKNKRGFSLVELVVIVGIIAIMTAIAVPNFIAYQRRADGQRQNENARGFYFAVQNTLLNTMENDNTEAEFFLFFPNPSGSPDPAPRRRSSPILPAGATSPPPHGQPIVSATALSGQNFFIYVVMGNDGKIASADLRLGAPDAPSDLANFPPSGGVNDDVFEHLIEEIDGYLAPDDRVGRHGNQGHYFAMFDTNFRVTMAYYSLHADRANIEGSASPYSYGRDNRISIESGGAQTFGAHPQQYAFADLNFRIRRNAANTFTDINPRAASDIRWFVPITTGTPPRPI